MLSKISAATGNPCFCFIVECNVWEWLTGPHWKSQGGLVYKCIWYLVMVNKCPSSSWINEVVLKLFTVVSSLSWIDTKHSQVAYKSHYIQKSQNGIQVTLCTKSHQNGHIKLPTTGASVVTTKYSVTDDRKLRCGRPKKKTLQYVQVIQNFNL